MNKSAGAALSVAQELSGERRVRKAGEDGVADGMVEEEYADERVVFRGGDGVLRDYGEVAVE